MGLFNRSDTEEKLRAIEVVLEQLAENAASQQKFNEASAAYVDGNDKKIAHLKKMIDLLIEDNRKLKEMVIKNDERYIETLESIKKLNDTFQARLAERTKLN